MRMKLSIGKKEDDLKILKTREIMMKEEINNMWMM